MRKAKPVQQALLFVLSAGLLVWATSGAVGNDCDGRLPEFDTDAKCVVDGPSGAGPKTTNACPPIGGTCTGYVVHDGPQNDFRCSGPSANLVGVIGCFPKVVATGFGVVPATAPCLQYQKCVPNPKGTNPPCVLSDILDKHQFLKEMIVCDTTPNDPPGPGS